MVGPAEAESGIGDYIEDLTTEMSESRVRSGILPMGCNNPIIFVKCAIQAGSMDADVIHLQHEYGMFGTVAAMSWAFFPILYVIAALRRTPVVITVHEGLNGDLVVPPLKRLKRVYLYILNRLIILNVAHVVFLSENTADEFTKSVPLTSYTVLPHGAHDVRHLEIEKDEAKRRLGYDPEQTVVAEPGYVEPRKGCDRLVNLAARMDEHEFLLAGGPSKKAYENYFEDIKDHAPANMTLTGFLDEMHFHASFVASDLVVLSYQEADQSGVVNTVNQSGIFNRCATYGVPVVASDLPYFRNIEEEWGCLKTCEFGDEGETERTIRELLNDGEERRRLSERIRAYAEARSFTEIAKQHEGIYQDIVFTGVND